MSDPQQSPTRPWAIEVLPELFGYRLLVEGQKFYIAKEHFDSVFVAMAMVKERESAGRDWVVELVDAVRGERGELSGTPATDG